MSKLILSKPKKPENVLMWYIDGPPQGNGADFDYININKPVHGVNEFGHAGIEDVLCGNGNFCGRNTSGPGMCSKSMIFVRACVIWYVMIYFEK